jgi:hypothetical protein
MTFYRSSMMLTQLLGRAAQIRSVLGPKWLSPVAVFYILWLCPLCRERGISHNTPPVPRGRLRSARTSPEPPAISQKPSFLRVNSAYRNC